MRISTLFSTFAIVLLVGTSATAQPRKSDDPRKDQADALYQEGNQLHNQHHDLEALETYKRAYAIYPSPVYLFNIAHQEHVLGRKLEAIRHYREALRNPLLPPRGVELGRKYVVELEPSFARVDLKGPSGLVVSLGNDAVKLPLPEPLDIEPGTVTATGVMDGQRYQGSAKAGAGEIVTIEMKVPNAMKVPPPEASDSPKRWGTGQYVGVSAAGVGVAAILTGVGFLVAKGHRTDDVKQLDAYTSVHGAGCTGATVSQACQALQSKRDDRNHDSAAAAGFLIGGVVALAAGAAAYFAWPKESSSRTGVFVKPIVNPRASGFELRF
ncbi:MAG: tetratricopeptide repeat protein [Polyangiaceae bacterium]|nr:tetratricopeptide repeat protein [Polyangiaceae bacterium]